MIFVLATTEPKKIPPTVLSRCQHLPFRRIPGQKIKERLGSISGSEGIKITGAALDMIARAADGSMRDSLTILDQIASFSEDITADEVKDLLGITDVETLSRLSAAVIEGRRKDLISIISELTNTGTDLKAFTRDLLQFIRNLLIAKIAGNTEEIIDLGEEESASLNSIKDTAAEEHIAILLSELIKAEPGIRNAYYPRISLEMTLIRLSMLSHLKSVNEAIRIIQGAGPAGGQESPPVKPLQTHRPAVQPSGGRQETGKAHESQKTDMEERAAGDTAAAASGARALRCKEDAPVPDIWNAAIERIDSTNHPLASKIREGSLSFDNDEIRIVFNGGLSIHAESVKENLPTIRKTIVEVSGRDIPLKIETAKTSAGPSRKDLKEKALQNPLVKEALELFEGRIVDVIPITKKGGDNV